jgi:5-methyltetrahydrofolate--homocysteine methyltransferase
MERFLDRLRNGGSVVADGAWGTMLIERGLPIGRAPETWTLERPEVLREIASAYLTAGAEILTSNTFGGSRIRLRQHHLDHRFEDVNEGAIRLLREAAGGRAWISGSIGPTGRLLAPHGDLDPAEAFTVFFDQARVLAEAGADILTIETMTDLVEAVAAVRAARQAAPALPIVATMTFDLTKRGPFTVMGNRVADAARELAAAGADVVGANCGAGLEAMLVVAEEFRRHASVPVAIRPNAGLPVREGSRLIYPETPEMFAAAVPRFGVAVFGGCCGTTPAHTAAVTFARRHA